MDKKVFLIGNAHLDPVWLWKRREGYAEIKATFQSALDMMEVSKGYVFTAAGASYYKWVEENEPEMFEKIRARIKEGRWAIVGGMWVQPDCNLPSGESFARQLLYSQRYFLEKFGIIAKTGYNVDSFGHNSMLPQLLKKAGISAYVFMRPMDVENKDVPALFKWKSPDGTTVDAAKVQLSYADTGWVYPPEKMNGRSVHQIKIVRTYELIDETGVPMLMTFYGVGNHGGGPTRRCLEEFDEITAADSKVVYSSPDEFFAELRKSGYELPVFDKPLQHHASGCYSASSAIKKNNRMTESRLVSAEKYDVLAACLAGSPSKREKLAAAWDRTMFNQFHDVMCGCCIEDAIDEANRYFNAAWADGEDVAEFALQKLSWNINTSGGITGKPTGKLDWKLWETEGQGAPIVVFNPHSFPVTDTIEIYHSRITGLTDSDGVFQPIQQVRGQYSNFGENNICIFNATLPAFGYRVYYAYTLKEGEFTADTFPSASGNTLENDFVRVVFDKATGGISELFDKRRGKSIINKTAAVPIVIDDTESDTWAHMIFKFDKQVGVFGNAEISVIENGPVRAAIRVVSSYNGSVLTSDFSLTPYDAAVTVSCKLNFNEKHKIVKLAFPIAADCSEAKYEMPFGFERIGCDGLEQPGHRYASLGGVGADGETLGLAVLNDCKYSYSAENNELRMNIVRSCAYADHYSERSLPMEYMDQGTQRFTYALLPCDGEDMSEATKRAMQLNRKPEHVMETNHGGSLKLSFNGISISADNVVCEAVKFAEDTQDSLVLRIYETTGRTADAEIALNIPGFETKFALHFGGHEIKTVRVDKDRTVTEINLIELSCDDPRLG